MEKISHLQALMEELCTHVAITDVVGVCAGSGKLYLYWTVPLFDVLSIIVMCLHVLFIFEKLKEL